MRNLRVILILIFCSTFSFAVMAEDEKAIFDYEITNSYLKDLEPEVIELSEYDKVRLPKAEISFDLEGNDNLVLNLEADKKPWPSWWYPSHAGELFGPIKISDKETNADYEFKPPLYIYDFIFDQNGNSSLDYLKKEFVPNASWSGACTLWALTSIYDEQPNKTLCLKKSADKGRISYSRVTDTNPGSSEIEHCEVTDGVVAYPGHLKALLALSYRRLSDYKGFFNDFIFGQLNIGSGYTDVRDIFPHEFISVLQFQLGVNKFPVIIDTDLSEAIWNHPIYKAEIDLTKKDENTLSVYITVDYVSPLNEGLGVLQRLNDMVAEVRLEQSTVRKIYKAEVYGSFNGTKFEVKTDGFRFERSAWVEDSINDHPDIVMAPPKLSAAQMKLLQRQVLSEILNNSSDEEKNSVRAEVDFSNIKTLLRF